MTHFLNQFISKLRNALSTTTTAPNDDLQSLRRIASELDHLDPVQAKFLAAFAFILYRVAYADHTVSTTESSAIEGALVQWGDLTRAQAVLVAELAKTQHRLFSGTDNFLVTREFKDFATPEQKTALLNCLFAVAASDDSVSNAESETVRIISKELGMEHSDYIGARQKFLDKLAALK